ncbi:helix-turn-helix domain-containing protein [Siphonobacter sp. SORGH_AS_0500]|uniref:helix-turn-helix domain-containing protein n=1 Tax=Siphonobacter sp. SORGH_AS_0500 TaxID=1864824 RepID=UPI00285A1D54|nr:helix-turn-helix domain-containing protein [Siphonobacter sp. SORGH_AS_0500]MDR6197516.1 AraC-like DNA-binding protein [Siphonobacter sp. SORGH_AS_0500]
MTVHYSDHQPSEPLQPFVFTFWKTQNTSGTDSHYTIIPDAGIELIFSIFPEQPQQIKLSGLSTHLLEITIPDQTVLFGVRFKLLAAEYLLRTRLSTNSSHKLPMDLGQLELHAHTPLASFVESVSALLYQQLHSQSIDPRKRKLLELVYQFKGAVSVHELALETGWAARQMNRYFKAWFGLPLKEYLEQLAFFSSLPEIGQGLFYPQSYYYDQSHFIRQTKKHTGKTPKQLYQQRKARFVQLDSSGDESLHLKK